MLNYHQISIYIDFLYIFVSVIVKGVTHEKNTTIYNFAV